MQRKADQRTRQRLIDDAVRQAHNATVQSPDGTQYFVRTVRKGHPLRQFDTAAGGDQSGLVLPLMIAAGAYFAILRAIAAMTQKRWTVGVIRERAGRRLEKVIYKETITDESRIEARVRQLADQVADGMIV